MSEGEILSRLGLALAIGFLIGVERGWRERQIPEGERAAGLRTFALVGLSGGVFALLGQTFGAPIVAAGFLAIGGTVAFFRCARGRPRGRLRRHHRRRGLPDLRPRRLRGRRRHDGRRRRGASPPWRSSPPRAGCTPGCKTLTWLEIRAALILAAMSFVALPVLPDRGFGPYDALNPRELWLMTIAIAGVSFIGYVAVKMVGSRYGPLVAGIAGGVVSSTITTVDLARKARKAPATRRQQLAGALAASATMFIRVAVIVAVFGPSLLPSVIGPLAVALVVTAAGAALTSASSFARPAGGWQRGVVVAHQSVRAENGPPVRCAPRRHRAGVARSRHPLWRPQRYRARRRRRPRRCRRAHAFP